MAKKTLQTNKTPNIMIRKVTGNLSIKGWERSEIVAKSSTDSEITIANDQNQVTIECPTDCVIYVPHSASLEITQVNGDARFKYIDGPIKIQAIAGDLILRDIKSSKVETIGGDLSAKRLRGNLVVRNVGGDASINNVDGLVAIDRIGGDLRLYGISGGITASAGGDLNADFAPVPWQAYSLQSGRDIFCRIPSDTNATLKVESGSNLIRIKTEKNGQTIKEHTYELALGEGGSPVQITAGGSVTIATQNLNIDSSLDSDIGLSSEINNIIEDITHRVTSQIDTQLDTQLSQLSQTIDTMGLSDARKEEIRLHIERAKAQAESRAKEASKRAQAKLEKKLAAAQRKAERKAQAAVARKARKERKKRGGIGVWKSSVMSDVTTNTEPVSDEERMIILKMLQNKKITVKEAETLLMALES